MSANDPWATPSIGGVRDDSEPDPFEIQDHEGRCGKCHTVHPIGSECW